MPTEKPIYVTKEMLEQARHIPEDAKERLMLVHFKDENENKEEIKK